jgi:predicted AlkP superfamily phosphohydrolase/phosphomutase
VDPADYERVRSQLAARLEAAPGPDGAPLGTRVFRPEDLYVAVEGIAPDLIVHFGDLAWRAVGGVGYPAVHVRENDSGPDDCNHALHGAFVLAGAGVPALGELQGVHLLDVAPTLLSLGGYDVPAEMLRPPLLEPGGDPDHPESAPDADTLVRERLRGLGYLG